MRDYKLILNLVTNERPQQKIFKQYDTGNEIELELFQNEHLNEDERLVLNKQTVLAFFKREDKQVLQKNCTIRNGNIIVVTSKDVLGVPGNLELECLVKDGDKETTTTRMIFSVQESINRSGAIEEDPRYNADLVTELLDVRDNVKAETIGGIEELQNEIGDIALKCSDNLNGVSTRLDNTKADYTKIEEFRFTKYFNAVTSDATNALKDYIAFCKANGLEEVFIPEGTWIVDGIDIDYPIHLRGTGRKSILKLKDNSTKGYVLGISDGTENVQIENLKILGNKGTNIDSIGIKCFGVTSHCSWDKLQIEDCGYDGMHIRGRDCRLSNITLYSCGRNGIDWHCGDSMASNILIYYCKGHAINFNIGANKLVNVKAYLCGEASPSDGTYMFKEGITNFQLTNVEAQENFGHGFKLYKNKLISFKNCIADANGISHAFGGDVPMTQPRNETIPQRNGFTIAGCENIVLDVTCNDFRQLASGGQYNQKYGVYVDDTSKNININANIINNEIPVEINANKDVISILNGTLKSFKDTTIGSVNGKIGFYGVNPITRPYVNGAKGGNEALGKLLVALHNLGLISNDTTL